MGGVNRADLHRDLQRGGYYPDLVARVLDVAVAGQEITSYLVHPQTSFDVREVYRHLTAVVLTPTRLIGVHVDDDPDAPTTHALATTEAVSLRRITSLSISHGVVNPAQAERSEVDELTIVVNWGNGARLDLQPAGCTDPNCDLDHGLTGVMTGEDLLIRVSAHADGPELLERALEFSSSLAHAVARWSE